MTGNAMRSDEVLGGLSAPQTELLATLADREAIRDCLLRYCRGIDRRDFAMVAAAYHPDALDDHGDYSGNIPGLIDWMTDRHRKVAQSLHAICSCFIEIVGDVAAVESSVV